jgi:hypothetical protein
MNVYRIEVKVAATMYVKAICELQARKLAAQCDVSEVRFSEHDTQIEVSGRMFDDPALPQISISPVGTLYVGKMKTVELAEEDV